MKATQMRTNGGYLFKGGYSKRSVVVTCDGQTPRRAGVWESLTVRRGRLQGCSGWRLEASEVIPLGNISGFLRLVLSRNQGQK